MGGPNGEHYDRSTSDGYARTSQGTSFVVEKVMSRSKLDPGLLPLGRKLICQARSPIVWEFDGTGSMGNLPKIFFDKAPLIAGQIKMNQYLEDAMVSMSVLGDARRGDKAPIQIGDFTELRKLDDWFSRIWLEGEGGGNHLESYDLPAYFYARFCEIPNARTPFYIITGDEGFYSSMYPSDLSRFFGGQHEPIKTELIFNELKRKFLGNVFLIHRRYGDSCLDEQIVRQWQNALDQEHVVLLGSDQAIADVMLGIFAIVGGTFTLEEYLEHLVSKRDVPQTPERISEVQTSLANVKMMKQVIQASGDASKDVEWNT